MEKTKKVDSREIKAVIMMACLFIIIYSLAILTTVAFTTSDDPPKVFENKDDPMNIVFVLAIMLVVTALILLIAKYWKKQVIQFIILGAVAYTAGYVFYFLLNRFIPTMPSFIFAASFAVVLALILYDYPEWYVIDICGVLVGAGAIAIFGISLGVLLVIILLIGLSIYDAISVYKTKHMIDLADTVMDLKLPVLLVIPKTSNYSLIKETKKLKESVEKGEERDAFFMGLGDVVMPGILVGAVYNSVADAMPIVVSIVAGTLIGFTVLMSFVLKGKPQAGLPALCGGAIGGYIVSSLILHGKLVGLNALF